MQYLFDNRRVVYKVRVIPLKMLSGDDREHHRAIRERTVRILLEDGEDLEVPQSALTPNPSPWPEETMAYLLASAKELWAKRRGELNLEGLIDNQTGERLDVIEVAFARWAKERAEDVEVSA